MKDFKLDEQPKIKSGFTAPDAYFEQFEQKLLANLVQGPKVISLKQKRFPWHHAAAAVVVMGMGLGFYIMLHRTEEASETAAIENYLALQFTTEEHLVNLLDADDLSELESEVSPDRQTLEEALLNNNNLEQYLLN